jgi:hypothetical protein
VIAGGDERGAHVRGGPLEVDRGRFNDGGDDDRALCSAVRPEEAVSLIFIERDEVQLPLERGECERRRAGWARQQVAHERRALGGSVGLEKFGAMDAVVRDEEGRVADGRKGGRI